MKRRFKVPLWVEIVYWVLYWVDYKVLSPTSSATVNWRNSLLNRYCRCEKCLERERERENTGAR